MAKFSIKAVISRIRERFTSSTETINYDKPLSEYTPPPITESRDYAKFMNKTLNKRLKQLVRNYKADPDNFELSSLEVVFNEIDEVTTCELFRIHEELSRQLTFIRQSIAQLHSDIYLKSTEAAIILQELENRYLALQEYLTEFRRPVVTNSRGAFPPASP